MTAYRIDSRVIDRFHSKINISVIYTKLATMERLDLIKCKPRNGKTYSLTEKGKKLLINRDLIIKEIQRSTIILFEK
jgi:DNA-binding PadR family transcriptional regulator